MDLDLSQTAAVNTDEPLMLGPPHPSDTDGLVPTLAALVRGYDHERRLKWAELVAKHREKMQRWALSMGRA